MYAMASAAPTASLPRLWKVHRSTGPWDEYWLKAGSSRTPC